MADKDIRDLSQQLESVKDTLTEGTPAQIPLLDDIVDDGEVQPPRRHKRAPRKRSARDHALNLHAPQTRDLFDTREQPEDVPGDDNVDHAARAELRAKADRVVDDLVAEYSSEILSRLRAELTEQLHLVLRDLEADSDDDKSSSS